MIGGGSDEQKDLMMIMKQKHIYTSFLQSMGLILFANGKECKTGEGDLSR